MGSRSAMRREPSRTHSVSRWSPTREQIAMLEDLYRQGMRTPNAEQIQEVTSRLRAYGHIQGKNVFYWFQNHKARQRQKQKLESIAYSNSFLQASHPICQNVVCAPFYPQQSGMNFYPQPEKVVATGGIVGTVVPFGMLKICDGQQIYQQLRQRVQPDYNYSINDKKTLNLFPLHPTGILKEKTVNQGSSHASASGCH
ncbi:hypothetical protein LR48_Vigan05g188500 [Vigna angularis]|uniref:Homeobox domain-containing protein n=2 Tax=Phaseolus angularis TaxID=3914 RepID=A0A0L9UN03_PHAAN|nr:WUSCHEL-related homeobox 2 [Vigna angularis]KOM44280.1 hypothetical protein LR48_Vigan05g188500 [Vigna angularis]BAT91880.1 hypothetical protein VIGAN_07051900 [Vigna angularis var. angularis]